MQAIEQVRAALEAMETIVCPACYSRLTLSDTTLDCAACGRRYPVADGIPVLLVDRATTPEKSMPEKPIG